MVRHIILPVSLMAGAIIGAGMFSLPYLFHQAGIILSLLILAALTFVVTFIHLLYADIILKTKGERNFVSYTREYLGLNASRVAFFMSIVEMIIVLVIYLILASKFIGSLIQSFWSLYPADSWISVIVLLFWIAGSIAIFWDLKELSLIQFLITVSMVVIISFVLIFAVFNGGSEKLFSEIYPLANGFNFNNLFVLLGPILFALSGRVVIVEVIKYFSPKKPLLEIRRSIILGTVIPAIIYAFFALSVLALSESVSLDSISGLIGSLPPFLIASFSILGLLAIWTSYIAVGFDVKNILQIDLNLSNFKSGAIVVFLPIVLYFAGLTDFIFLISLVGGLFLTLESIFIVKMWQKLDKKNNPPAGGGIFLYIVVFILCITLIYEIWKLLTGFY